METDVLERDEQRKVKERERGCVCVALASWMSRAKNIKVKNLLRT